MSAQSAHDWEDTFNTITDMITIHDKDFTIIRANRAARERLDLSADGMGAQKCFRYFHGADCPRDCPSWEHRPAQPSLRPFEPT
jgi:PAS domain-containing protein